MNAGALIQEWRHGMVAILNPKNQHGVSEQKNLGVDDWYELIRYTLSFVQRRETFVTQAHIDHLIELYPFFLCGTYTSHAAVPAFVTDRFQRVCSPGPSSLTLPAAEGHSRRTAL